MDACGQEGDHIINPLLGFVSTLVDVTSSTKLNYAEDVNLPDRRRGPHYESFEEDSGFDDPSGHSTSKGGESPETNEELSTSKPPLKLPTRKLP
jgi:hypothetical protein